MWKSFKDLPTLTELFFGKGVDPATYKGEDKTPAYLSGKGKPRGTRKDYSLQTKLKKSLKE